jgi:4-hydroxybenzoate polyprenyltransferase
MRGAGRFRSGRLYSAAVFVRFSALGGSLVLPLLGAASVAGRPGPAELAVLLGVAAAFHLFAYVSNDVADLEIDRTEPRRADSPLVRGTIGPGTALAIALVQFPVALLLTAMLRQGAAPRGYLAASFLLLGIYNLWGKRCFFPPLTDLLQGLGWASLVLYGASLTGSPTVLTWTIAVFIAIFIVMANGVHGALRDIRNDLRCGVRSTAIMFGACPIDSNRLRIPGALHVYAAALQTLLAFALLIPLGFGEGFSSPAVPVALLILQGLSFVFLFAGSRAPDNETRGYTGLLQLVVSLASPIALVAPNLPPAVLVVVLIAYLGPLLSHRWLSGALKWVWSSMVSSAAGHPVNE